MVCDVAAFARNLYALGSTGVCLIAFFHFLEKRNTSRFLTNSQQVHTRTCERPVPLIRAKTLNSIMRMPIKWALRIISGSRNQFLDCKSMVIMISRERILGLPFTSIDPRRG